jgi:hypothetical protein
MAMEQVPPVKETPARWTALMAFSLAVVTAIAASAPWISNMAKGWNPGSWGMLPLGASFILLAMSSLNALARRRGRGDWFSPREIMAAFFVIMMGSWMTSWGFGETQMPLITSPYVFASADNGWTEFIHPNLPKWALGPTEEPFASGFYNGLPADAARPWGRWAMPVMAWTCFVLVLTLFSLGMSSILGRKWIENDRLIFPHAEVLAGTARGFISDKRFWYGIAVAAVIPGWNFFARVFPVFPAINLTFGGGPIEWVKNAEKIVAVLSIGALGLFYFVHRDIIISMCIFFVLISLEAKFFNLAGFKLEHGDVYGWGEAVTGWQTSGAILAMVLIGLWASRGWLKRFWKRAKKGEDLGRGWLSPRGALAAVTIGVVGLGVWMALLGLKSPVSLLSFVLNHFIGYIGMARLTMESSMEVNWPVEPGSYAILAMGTKAILPAGFVALALTQCWTPGSSYAGPLNPAMTGEKSQADRRFPRKVVFAVLIAAALSTAITMLMTAKLGYSKGANNFGNWSYQYHMRIPYEQATECIRGEKTGPDLPRAGWVAAGAVMMGALVFLRNNVTGWFLHPIGFVLGALGKPGGAFGNTVVFTAFLAWSIKTLFLKLGGVETYEKWKPFFGGLVFGGFIPGIVQLVHAIVYYLVMGRAFGQ